MFFLLLLFLPLILSNSTETSAAATSGISKTTTRKVIQIPTTKIASPPDANIKNGYVTNVAERLANACFKFEHEKQKHFNMFITECLYDKKLKNVTEIEQHWDFCCRLRHRCHDGPSTDHNCRDIFCDCLDLVNLSTEPSTSSCRATDRSEEKYKIDDICGEDIEPFQDRYVNIYENVGFAAIYGKNLVFGTSGWIFTAIIFTIFLSATAYLIVSYVQFKCNKVTKEVIATKEGETHDEYSFPPPRPAPSQKFHDKIILKS
uniref:Uncharacterized protein n=1 Tax=Panagrolaimus sp. ES5 TaxID=591445 RepID=A0AC34F2T7_9BILA